MDVQEQIEQFKDLIDTHYKTQLYETIQTGKKSLVLDFNIIESVAPGLADAVLEQPEDVIRSAELALEQFDFTHVEHPENVKNLRIRIRKLPESRRMKISNVRSEHLGLFVMIEGIVRQASDVRPQVTSAKFECAGCGNTLSILQIDTKFKEPNRCTCGWRGKFRLLTKDLIDVQHLKVEEAPESLDGGEQPKRLSIFLKEDLVEPRMEKKTSPGSRVHIYGIVKEVPIQLKTGAQSVRYDLIMEANHIEPVQEDFSEIKLSKEDEDQILTLGKDPLIFEKLTSAIAPSIYGHEKIKAALVLQLMGGVRKKKPDGIITRGDIHILCIGDPGCIAGSSQVALYHKGMQHIQQLGNSHLQPIHEIVTKIRKNPSDKPYDFATVFHKYPQQPVVTLVTESGKEIVCTYNQPFLTKEGWVRADHLPIGTPIRVMPKIPHIIKQEISTSFSYLPHTSGRFKEVNLPKTFTPALAALCGYIIGDGHIHRDEYTTTCYVNNEETDLIPQLTSYFQQTFGVQPSIYVKDHPTAQIKFIDNANGTVREIISQQTLYHLEVNSKQVTHCLSFLSSKRVPQAIFQSPNPVVSSFLSWLFDADGTVFANGRGRTAIQLKSRTLGLLKDVQLLLLYFGIHSRINHDNLCIRRAYDMELFAMHIGFNSHKKKERLQHLLHSLTMRSDKQKRKLYQRWEKVTHIIPSGVIDVYDFEVPDTHTFIANGLVCHNSGKSQILQFMSKAAPKARFVSGKGASVDYKEPLLIKQNDAIKIIKIGELVDHYSENMEEKFVPLHEKIEILSVNIKTKKLEWKAIDSVYKHRASGKLLKFTLESGREVTVTKDHSIFILEDGKTIVKNASELKIKDCAIVPTQIPNQAKIILPPGLARLIGYYIAEGHMRNDDSSYKIEFTLNKAEEHIVQDIKYLSKTYLNNEAKSYPHGDNGIRVIIYRKEAYEKFAELLGEPLVNAHALTKRVPQIILNSQSEARIEFIKGYIAGDAGVTKSKYLISDLLYLYLEEKIIASYNSRLEHGETEIRGRKIKMRGYRYDLKAPHPKKRYINRYCNPPFESINKSLNDSFFKRIISNDYSRVNINRIGNRKFFERLIYISENILSHGPDLKNRFGESILQYFENNNNIFMKIKNGRSCLISLSDYGVELMQELLKFKTLMNGDLGFVRIKKIEEVDSSSQYVYDVSVPENENFIGGFGGLLLHNSGAGLTAAVVKDEFLKGWALEAGALVLANKGLCVVDELDKIDKEDTAALHSAMEQQIIPISKANIQATLHAETTLLAAANPKLGRFDPYTPIASQIDLPSTLINRFDLIFPVRDIPNTEKDTRIALHVLSTSNDQKIYDNEISVHLLRKYISYGRTIIPKLSAEAIDEIKTFYVTLRNSGKEEGGVKPIPISARQLEGLIRLAEASARVRLDSTITREDARRAIDLLNYCLMQVGFDQETGQIDIDRISTGITASTRGKIMTVKEIIFHLEERGQKTILIEDILAEAAKRGIEEHKVEEAIEQLKKSGDIFSPKGGYIQRI